MKTVIFDLDGTLLDTIGTISYYGNKALEHFGFKTHSEDAYKYFAGNGAKVLVERALSESGALNEENFKKVFEYYIDIYHREALYLTKPFDGIKEMLKELKKDGVKTAVLSNKPDIAVKAVVKTFLGEDLIDLCYGQREEVPLKPDPTAVYMILGELGSKKEEAFFVGDTSVDILTGINANITPIGITWGFRPKDELLGAGAKLIADNTKELIEIIRSN